MDYVDDMQMFGKNKVKFVTKETFGKKEKLWLNVSFLKILWMEFTIVIQKT